MAQDSKKIADSIRSGSYYGQARGWFQAVYINPVAERSFFLIIATLAAVVALFSIVSVVRLMPLTKREAILIYAPERADERQASLIPLAADKHEAVNPALSRFYVAQYVKARESFSATGFLPNAKFVRGQSDEVTYAAYAQSYNPSNPQSPLAPLVDGGLRRVNIHSIRMREVNGVTSAEVKFTVTTLASQQETNSEWTAKLDYLYTQITPELVTTDDGQKELRVNDPHFQVTHYELAQRT